MSTEKDEPKQAPPEFSFIGRQNTACGYWDDEPDSPF